MFSYNPQVNSDKQSTSAETQRMPANLLRTWSVNSRDIKFELEAARVTLEVGRTNKNHGSSRPILVQSH